MLSIPTEPIGSIPRPLGLISAVAVTDGADVEVQPLYEEAIRDTIERFEATGSPVITDGEQRKYHNFWTYCVHGLPNTAPDGFKIPFSAGHVRRMPRLTRAQRRGGKSCPSGRCTQHVPISRSGPHISSGGLQSARNARPS